MNTLSTRPWKCGGRSPKILRNTARVLRVGPQTRVIFVRYNAQGAWSCSRYAVEPSRLLWAKPSIPSTFLTKWHMIPTFQYAECPETCPWKCEGGQAGGGGADGGGVVQICTQQINTRLVQTQAAAVTELLDHLSRSH